MTMVSELVLTRNQLLDIVRHATYQVDKFQNFLNQRLSNVTAELGRGDAHPHAADRQLLAEAAAHRPRRLSAELGKDY